MWNFERATSITFKQRVVCACVYQKVKCKWILIRVKEKKIIIYDNPLYNLSKPINLEPRRMFNFLSLWIAFRFKLDLNWNSLPPAFPTMLILLTLHYFSITLSPSNILCYLLISEVYYLLFVLLHLNVNSEGQIFVFLVHQYIWILRAVLDT